MEKGGDLDKRVQRSGHFPPLSTGREINVVFLSLGNSSKTVCSGFPTCFAPEKKMNEAPVLSFFST